MFQSAVFAVVVVDDGADAIYCVDYLVSIRCIRGSRCRPAAPTGTAVSYGFNPLYSR